MKKISFFLNDQSGFYLPYVLFITVIILLTVVTNVNLYQQNISMTGQHLDQLRIETLTQMAHEKFANEYPVIESKELRVYYSFPYGNVELLYHRLDDTAYNLRIDVFTAEQSEHTTLRTQTYEELD